ncbi:MAG: hypothetical protein O2U61_04505 [Candidatus Bathyarchaeota archaeon]|nr:hypothetical protein [Candidatus Bathyarchaeota archaeon]
MPSMVFYITIIVAVVTLVKDRKKEKKTMGTVRTGVVTHHRRISTGTVLMIVIIIALLVSIAVPIFFDHVLLGLP